MGSSRVLVPAFLFLTGGVFAVLAAAPPASIPDGPSEVAHVEVVRAPAAPTLASLRTAIEACAFDAEHGFGSGGQCAASATLAENASARPDGFASMVRWLEDSSAAVRLAGAHALYVGFEDASAFADCAAMGQALDAMAKEPAPVTSAALGGVVARFAARCDAHETALLERLDDAAPNHALGREELMHGLAATTVTRPAVFHALATVAYDGREATSLRQEALDGCIRAEPTRPDAVSALLAELAKDGNAAVAERASELRGGSAVAVASR